MLEARAIGRRRAGGKWMIHDVALALAPGDRAAIRGASGSGKTVLLRALAALDPIDAGTLTWNGEPVHGARVPHYRSCAVYLHQRPALFDGTVEETLRRPFALRVHAGRRYDAHRIVDWLGELGRDAELLARRTRDLSGGEAQIVALLRAIQLEPTILLLDEPTGALDPDAARSVEALVDRWFRERGKGRALLWVTHDELQATRCTDRVLRMVRGRLEAE